MDVPDFSISEVQFDGVVQHIQALGVHKAVGYLHALLKPLPNGMTVVLNKTD